MAERVEGMIPLHSNSMHNFILRELEIGTRAAMIEDDEYVMCYPSAILDIQYREHCREYGWL